MDGDGPWIGVHHHELEKIRQTTRIKNDVIVIFQDGGHCVLLNPMLNKIEGIVKYELIAKSHVKTIDFFLFCKNTDTVVKTLSGRWYWWAFVLIYDFSCTRTIRKIPVDHTNHAADLMDGYYIAWQVWF